MDKAVTYIQNCLDTLATYLEDGRCSFSNNLNENAICPFTLGHKNWLFSESPEGTKASTTVYTMVETAKAHDLNIYKYLKYLLDQRPNRKWSNEQLKKRALWSCEVKQLCNNN